MKKKRQLQGKEERHTEEGVLKLFLDKFGVHG